MDWLALCKDYVDATKRWTEKKRTMMSGEGVVTRSRKRKVAQRDSLWDLIVNNDDICFTHILPRLDLTDLRILVRSEYGDEKVDQEIISQGELKETFL